MPEVKVPSLIQIPRAEQGGKGWRDDLEDEREDIQHKVPFGSKARPS